VASWETAPAPAGGEVVGTAPPTSITVPPPSRATEAASAQPPEQARAQPPSPRAAEKKKKGFFGRVLDVFR
jgi:hypothetical protein